jgi:phosphoglycerol transferase MdoB-like AlkP superfamily enzyme
METTTVETTSYYGHIGIVPILVILALAVIPYWKIWSRTGHSGAWSLLMLVPIANLISLWVLAFKDWPAMRGKR